MFKTIIGVLQGETQKIIKICEDIRKKDSTFDFYIVIPTVKEIKDKFESVLVICSSTKKRANQWGGWFIHKCHDAKVASYFWVKEATNKKN